MILKKSKKLITVNRMIKNSQFWKFLSQFSNWEIKLYHHFLASSTLVIIDIILLA